jgi:eukaryotic-like serine/threonine-protein kinase
VRRGSLLEQLEEMWCSPPKNPQCRGIVLNRQQHSRISKSGDAYAMLGDTAKARAAYQDFLTLWEDADPDIPILIAAKSEYAKLK